MMSELSQSFGLSGFKATQNPLHKVTSLFMAAMHEAVQPKNRLKKYVCPDNAPVASILALIATQSYN
jgi:hypothetical protein